jgi:hypothetical protein
MWRAPEATAPGPSEWIAKLSCVVAPQATMTVAGALLFDPQHVGTRGRWLFHHQHSIFNPQFFDFPATTELSVGKSFGCHEPELVSIIRNLSCPKRVGFGKRKDFFPITISKREFDRTPGGALVFFGQWSVSGLSAEALAEIERAAKLF